MPTYEYACKSCGTHIEVAQSFTDDSLTTCESCGGDLRKVFGAIGITFKGSGFYKNDSRPSESSSSSTGESKPAEAKPTETSTSESKSSESPASTNKSSETPASTSKPSESPASTNKSSSPDSAKAG